MIPAEWIANKVSAGRAGYDVRSWFSTLPPGPRTACCRFPGRRATILVDHLTYGTAP